MNTLKAVVLKVAFPQICWSRLPLHYWMGLFFFISGLCSVQSFYPIELLSCFVAVGWVTREAHLIQVQQLPAVYLLGTSLAWE